MSRVIQATALLLTLLVLAVGCNGSDRPSPGDADVIADSPVTFSTPPTLDYSSEEALQASLAKVRESLSEPDQRELELSLMAITLAMEGDEGKIKEQVHGKTAQEVIEYANGLE